MGFSLCSRLVLYSCSSRVREWSSLLSRSTRLSKSWPLLSVACLWEFVVQPGLWPSPKSHRRKANYSATGEVSSLRLLTNYSLRSWRAQSELLAESVFLARVKVKPAPRLKEMLLKAKRHLSHTAQCLSAEEEDRVHVVRAKEKFSPCTRGLIWLTVPSLATQLTLHLIK